MKTLIELGFKASELDLIKQCLVATTEGPFFEDWEFQTLIGLRRTEVQSVLDSWPDIDLRKTNELCGVHSSMGNLLGYPHGHDNVWDSYIVGSKEDVRLVMERWSKLTREYRAIS